jgi:WD40 repeat protein
LAEFIQVIPAEWLTEQQIPPRYEMRITPLATYIAECKYEPSGAVSRIRVDIDVSITDLEDNNKLMGDEHFKGYPPDYDDCPYILSSGDSTIVLGLPTITEFRHWVVETILTNTKLPAPAAGVSSLAFSPDGKVLVLGSEDGTVKFLDMATTQVSQVLTGHQGEVLNVAISSDGKLLASTSKDGTTKLWDIATRMELDTYPSESSPTLFFSANGKMLVAGWLVWDTSRRGKAFGTLSVGSALSPDGITYATTFDVNGVNGLSLREILTDKELQFLDTDIYIDVIAYSPDGKVIAIGGYGDEYITRVRFLNADTLQEILTVEKPGDFESIVFSPDGTILATRNKESIRLWDVATGRELHAFSDPWFTSLAFSPDGKTLSTGSWTGVVTFWDLATGDKLAEFKNTFYVQ